MQADIAQGIIQVLSSPIWNGIAGLAAAASVPLSILLARSSQHQKPASNTPNFKKSVEAKVTYF